MTSTASQSSFPRSTRPASLFGAFAVMMLASGSALAGQVQDRAGAIQGQITDMSTGRPLGGVHVTLLNTGVETYTDGQGRYTLQPVSPGVYVLQARRIGFQQFERTGVSVTAGPPVEVTVQMSQVPIRLRDITVSPGSFSFMETGPAVRQTMSREDIQTVPQFGEDIFRAVTRLPGLTSGDFTAQFSIRGGRQDETLIVLDGLEIYEPYHLKDFNEGAISIIDVETIEGVELMTGGFPVKFGNKRSGVFSMTSKSQVGGPTRASIGASFINARAMAEGSFAGTKGSWFVSGRRGYLDLIFGLLGVDDVPSPAYHDVFSKVRYQLHDRHSLSVNVLHAYDSYTVNSNATTGFQDTIATKEIANNRYGNSYTWLTLHSQLHPRLSVRSMVSGGLVTTTRDGSEFHRFSPDTIYNIQNNRDFGVFGAKQDWVLEPLDALVVAFGFDYRYFNADYLLTSRVWTDPENRTTATDEFYPAVTVSTNGQNGNLVAGYVSNRLRILDPLTFELGARFDYASYTGDKDWSPRVNALLDVSDNNTLRLGWGYYRQTQSIADFAALDGLGRYFPSELSRQWTLGLENRSWGGSVTRIEAYYKKGSNLRPTFRNWRGAIDVFPETDEDRVLVFPDANTSKGIELYHNRRISEKISLRGSYAFALVEETVGRIDNINDPIPLTFRPTHPAPQDQRHAFNLDVTYRPAPNWSVNISNAFHTGWPATVENVRQVTGTQGQPEFLIRPDTLYDSRLPNYQRLDARITKRAGNLRFFFELLNVTNHRNVYGYDYFALPEANGGVNLQRDLESWFTILPSLGISWNKTF